MERPSSLKTETHPERPTQFQIDNMACGGCARSVTRAIRSVDPQARVEIDLHLRRVMVESAADDAAVAAVLADLGFPPRREA